MQSKKLKEDLAKTLDEAEWSWLKPHAQRDAIVMVAQGLDLLVVAEAIALNSSTQVQDWIAQGLLSKPTQEQMDAWDQESGRKFMSLVVQPFVLIQDRFH